MPEWSPENIGEALISKRVDAKGMGNLLDVLFLGGEAQQDVEKAQGDSASTSNAPKSQQLDETFEKMAAGEYVHPQYDPNIWAQTSKMSTRLARCIRSYARNTVGLGWEVEPLRPLTSMDVKAERMAEGPPKSDKKPGAAAADKDKVTKIGLNDGPMSLGEALQPDGAPEPRSQQPTPTEEEQAPTWDGWSESSPNGESTAADESLAEARLQEKKEVEWQTEALRDLFEHPNDHIPFTELMYLVKNDEETVGNGYLEVVRNAAGRIVQLHHVPATTVRRRLMKDSDGDGNKGVYGFIQLRGAQKRYFKEFGDVRLMDAYTGKWHEGDGFLELGKRATEILHFAVYDPTSQYYGAPRYVPSATAIAGNRQSAIRNVSFFENDAVPRMALLVSGGRLTPDSMQQIEDFLRGKARGVDQAHRCMIIQVEPAKVGFQQQSKVAVELKPLTVGVTEDASFAQYRKDNDEEIREIFGMGQIFFTSEGANRANAQVAREITNEQEFEPDRLAKEYIINQTIVCDVLKHELLSRSDLNNDGVIDEFEMRRMVRQKIRVRFRFARMTLTDPMDSARMDQVYAQLGAITPNEMRASLGKPPYPKEYFFADKPLQIAMAELSAGLALAIALDPEAEPPEQEGAPGAPGAEPKGLPGMPGMSGMPALGGDYADGIEVEGAEGLPDGDPRRPRMQVRPIHPGQGDRKPKVAPIRIPKHEGLRIASEMLADARKLGMIGASLMEGQDGTEQ